MLSTTILATVATTFLLSGGADAHAHVTAVSAKNGVAGPMNNIREGIRRNGQDVPGNPAPNCGNHCVLENVPDQEQLYPGKFFTSRPSAHWDRPEVWPERPCMSEDTYGTRGVLRLEAGETIDWQWYMKADHGGFYNFQLAAGEEPTNAEFMANPLTPWYSLHESAETPGYTYPERVVGWGKNDTDTYLYRQTWVGAGNPERMNPTEQEMNSPYCQDPANYHQCYIDDKITIPPNTPAGTYVFRFNWFCAETRQDYNNCLDVEIVAPSMCPGGSLPECIGACPVNDDYAQCVDDCISMC